MDSKLQINLSLVWLIRVDPFCSPSGQHFHPTIESGGEAAVRIVRPFHACLTAPRECEGNLMACLLGEDFAYGCVLRQHFSRSYLMVTLCSSLFILPL